MGGGEAGVWWMGWAAGGVGESLTRRRKEGSLAPLPPSPMSYAAAAAGLHLLRAGTKFTSEQAQVDFVKNTLKLPVRKI